MILQPGHERPVVGQAAQERHGGMAMQIDQAGQQEVLVQHRLAHWRKARQRFPFRQERDDPAAMDGDGMVLENRVGGFDRYRPARAYQEVNGFGHDCWGGILPQQGAGVSVCALEPWGALLPAHGKLLPT